jgi:hypothetical protein
MKVITIKFENAREWKFLLDLVRRLNLRFEWKEETVELPKDKKPDTSPDIVAKLFGSFHSELSPDELVKSLYDARVNQTREINLYSA